jgi:hypothetical protein
LALAGNGQTLVIGVPGHDQKNPGESGFVRLLARPKPIDKPQIQRHPNNLTLQLIEGRMIEGQSAVSLTYGFGAQVGKPVQLERDWAIVDTATAQTRRGAAIDLLLHSRQRDTVQRWNISPNGQVNAMDNLRSPNGKILRTGNPQWRLVAWARFNPPQPNPQLDLFWHNPISDEMAFWTLAADRVTVTSYNYLYDRQGTRIKTGNSGWEICAIADLDGNGQPDLLLRLPALNQTAVIRLDGKVFVEAQYLPSPSIADLRYRDIWYWEGHSQVTINWQNATQTQVLQQPVNCVNGRFVADQFMPLA